MRVDLQHLMLKGDLALLRTRALSYVELMAGRGQPPERVVVTRAQYDALMSRAHGKLPGARFIELTCKSVPVFWSATEPMPQAPPPRPVKPPIDLSGYTSPFGAVGVAAPAPVQSWQDDPEFDDDDSIPF